MFIIMLEVSLIAQKLSLPFNKPPNFLPCFKNKRILTISLQIVKIIRKNTFKGHSIMDKRIRNDSFRVEYCILF